MLGMFMALVQLAGAPPGVLSVRAGERTAVVPLVQTSAGPALGVERLSPLLDAQLRADGTGRFVLTIEGVSFQLGEQIPFTRVGTEVVPMVGSPFMSGARLHVPLQLVVELLPRFLPGTVYDPARNELRVARTLATARPPAAQGRPEGVPAAGASPPATQPPAPALPRAVRTDPPPPRKRIVVIDAGHGGHDPGTSGRARSGARLVEKDVALAVSKLLETELRKRRIDVVMTRSTDVFVPLGQRGKIANDRGGDLFISIHVNASAPNRRGAAAARGIETYFLAVAKTEDAQRVADMENASVRFETVSNISKEDPLSFIINDMAENEHLRESSDLAALIQTQLAAGRPGSNRGVKQAPFRVLVTSYMPAVLVELGFASNVDDAAILLDRAHQRKMAAAIADAAMEYFDAYDLRIGVGH